LHLLSSPFHRCILRAPFAGPSSLMRKLAVLVVFVLLLALGSAFVRIQPRGAATLFRRGQQVTVRTQPLYVRPLAYDSRCRAATAGERLLFDALASGWSASGDEIVAHVRYTYNIPTATVPANWP